MAAVSPRRRRRTAVTRSSTPRCARSPGSTAASSSTSASSSTARRWTTSRRRSSLDPVRLRAIAPDVDIDAVRTSAEAVVVACRTPVGLARENEGQAVRFGMLTAPRSTVVQPSPVHAGHDHPPGADARPAARPAGRTAGLRPRRPAPGRGRLWSHVAPPDRPRDPAPPRRVHRLGRHPGREPARARARRPTARRDLRRWTSCGPSSAARCSRPGPTGSSTAATPSTARPSSWRSASPTAATRCTGCSAGRTGRSARSPTTPSRSPPSCAPSAGYPHRIVVEATYALADDGLTTTVSAWSLSGRAPYGVSAHPYLTAGGADLDAMRPDAPGRPLRRDRGRPAAARRRARRGRRALAGLPRGRP